MKYIYITTAIDYANGLPHIGHLYEKTLADIIVRINKLQKKKCIFLIGLDEHGQKVQKSALSKCLTPKEYCDYIANIYKNIYNTYSIKYNIFIRTSKIHHKEVVTNILQMLYDKGEIYKGQYCGFYSLKQEQFLLQGERNIDGTWPDIYGDVVTLKEEAYFFKLSKYQNWLIEYIKNNNNFIIPHYRQNEVLNFLLKEELNDLCISRPKFRLKWGITLPFDKNFVCYVWFDALINYISAIHYGSEIFNNFWPADYQIIGKDILIPTHAIYWPIILHAIGLLPPKHLLVHGWLNIKGTKISKTTYNYKDIDLFKIATKYGSDSLRYFLTREISIGQDYNFDINIFISKYKNELANILGNLINRLLTMGTLYTNSTIPPIILLEDPEIKLINLWNDTYQKVLKYYNRLIFNKALETTFLFIQEINKYIEIRAPWKQAKSDKDIAILHSTIATIAEAIRLALVLLDPIIPISSKKIYKILDKYVHFSYSENNSWSEKFKGATWNKNIILFPFIN